MLGKTCAAAAAVFLLACTEISGNKNDVLSVKFDTLASPSVVVGDTLRDTLGVIALPHVTAFNFQNDSVHSAVVRFRSPDGGISIDSLTGLIVGDSLRATSVRIIAAVGALQAQQLLGLSLRPDTISAATASPDTLKESLLDTTTNFSKGFSVKLVHHNAVDSAVPNYIVSFQIVSPPGSSAFDLVNEGGKVSIVDTTDANGLAGRRVHLHLGGSEAVPDSVIVNATAKYRGVKVKGSPVRLVVKIVKS